MEGHWFSSMERCGLSEMNLDMEVEEVKEQQHGVIFLVALVFCF